MALFLLTFPVPRNSPLQSFSSLDVSWVYGLNVAAASNMAFGSEVMFTYGPLGFLLYPLDLGHNVLVSMLFRLLLSGSTSVLLFLVLRDPRRTTGARIGFVIFVSLAAMFNTEVQLCGVILIGLVIWYQSPGFRTIVVVASLVATLATMIKFSLGMTSMSLVAMYAYQRGRETRIAWRQALAFALVVAIVALGLFALVTGSVRDLWLITRGSLELASGYSSAMALAGSTSELVQGIGLVVLLGFMAITASGRLRSAARLAFPALVIAFKQGFVRQDVYHVAIFVSFALYVAAAMLAAEELSRLKRSDRLLMIGYLTGCLGVAGFAATQSLRVTGVSFLGEAGHAMRDGRSFLAILEFGQTVRRNYESMVASTHVPAEIVELTRGKDTDFMPWNAAAGAIGPVRWKPRPVFQSYAAYTPWLEALNVHHFRKPGAPQYVVFEPAAMDGYHPFFFEPGTFHEISCRYTLRLRKGRYLLLERSSGRQCRLTDLVARRVEFGQAVRVDSYAGKLLLAGLDVTPSVYGRLAQTVLRLPPAHLEITYMDGVRRRYRFTIATAKSGLVIGHLPRDLDEIETWLRNGLGPPVDSFRVVTDAAWAYQSQLTVRLWQSE